MRAGRGLPRGGWAEWLRWADALPRYTSHLILILLTLLVTYFGSLRPFDLRFEDWIRPASASTGLLLMPGSSIALTPEHLLKNISPVTVIPPRPRREVITYTVQSGDTVFGIAEKFGLQPTTILWSNPELENNADLLALGQEVFIIPVDGAYHQVGAGDTLESIAQVYKVDVSAIINAEWNKLRPPYELQIGSWLVIPDGRKPILLHMVRAQYAGPPPPGAAQGTGNFMWPVSGYITQNYWQGHLGIDIGGPCGTPIYAADSGYVSAIGWEGGYGNRIVINHGNGFETMYAHLSQILVNDGTSIGKGALIGRVGNTGRSTGCHLHLEIRQYGNKRNPYGFLPR